jgi:SAM-dependent methyltransferase
VSERIEARVCSMSSLGIEDLAGRIDFAFAIHMVHEVPDAAALIAQIHAALRPGGTFVIVEPKGHVTPSAFDATIARAIAAGFDRAATPGKARPLEAVFVKRGEAGA